MTPETEIAALKAKVAQLERTVATLAQRSIIVDSSSRNATPNGFLEIMIGGDTVRLPYYGAN